MKSTEINDVVRNFCTHPIPNPVAGSISRETNMTPANVSNQAGNFQSIGISMRIRNRPNTTKGRLPMITCPAVMAFSGGFTIFSANRAGKLMTNSLMFVVQRC
jgi:hypothetical protein